MSLAEELAEAGEARTVTRCGVASILAALNAEDSTALADWLARPASEAPGTRIAKVLRARGHRISEFTVQRHRRGACSCVPS